MYHLSLLQQIHVLLYFCFGPVGGSLHSPYLLLPGARQEVWTHTHTQSLSFPDTHRLSRGKKNNTRWERNGLGNFISPELKVFGRQYASAGYGRSCTGRKMKPCSGLIWLEGPWRRQTVQGGSSCGSPHQPVLSYCTGTPGAPAEALASVLGSGPSGLELYPWGPV